jgi:cytochrome c1
VLPAERNQQVQPGGLLLPEQQVLPVLAQPVLQQVLQQPAVQLVRFLFWQQEPELPVL